MHLRFVAGIALAAGLSLSLAACGANPCPFGLVGKPGAQGTVTGAFKAHDVTVPSESKLELDLSHSAPNGQVDKADAWLTTGDCVQLFDGPYPAPTASALCRVLIGPVAAGTVSARSKADPGRYRVFVQAYTSNQGSPAYAVDVGIWGRSCRGFLM